MLPSCMAFICNKQQISVLISTLWMHVFLLSQPLTKERFTTDHILTCLIFNNYSCPAFVSGSSCFFFFFCLSSSVSTHYSHNPMGSLACKHRRPAQVQHVNLYPVSSGCAEGFVFKMKNMTVNGAHKAVLLLI